MNVGKEFLSKEEVDLFRLIRRGRVRRKKEVC